MVYEVEVYDLKVGLRKPPVRLWKKDCLSQQLS